MSRFCERGNERERCGSHGAVDNTAVWYATFRNPLPRSSGYNSTLHSTLTEIACSPRNNYTFLLGDRTSRPNSVLLNTGVLLATSRSPTGTTTVSLHVANHNSFVSCLKASYSVAKLVPKPQHIRTNKMTSIFFFTGTNMT